MLGGTIKLDNISDIEIGLFTSENTSENVFKCTNPCNVLLSNIQVAPVLPLNELIIEVTL